MRVPLIGKRLRMYSYDKTKKKIVAPDASELSPQEVVMHLNQMYQAIINLNYSWRVISDGVAIMDNIFMGANKPTEEEGVHEVVAEGDDSSTEVVPAE
jgi:hypothetical protein